MMTNIATEVNLNTWQQAEEYLISENYYAATQFYEQAIEADPSNRLNYWYLGLMLLLQNQETEAQMTWMMALAETDNEEIYAQELIGILDKEAQRRQTLKDNIIGWGLRKHIQELAPYNLDNLLHLLQLAINLNFFTQSDDELVEVIELLPESENYNQDLLLETLRILLPYAKEKDLVFDLVKTSLDCFPNTQTIIDCLMKESIKIAVFYKNPKLAAKFAELCLYIWPNHREILTHISYFYQNSHQYIKGIEAAKKCQEISENIAESLTANYLVIRALMTASGYYWHEGEERINIYKILAKQFMEIESEQQPIDKVTTMRLFMAPFFVQYFEDNPAENRYLQNRICSLAHKNLLSSYQDLEQEYQKSFVIRKEKDKSLPKKITRPLNLGYLSHCFKKHSVGWLCRWLFKYHDADKFKIHIYSLNNVEQVDSFTQRHFVDTAYKFHKISVGDSQLTWDQIQQDEIDILVDLDSITLDITCEIMSVKSAPIQVTWLGWDGSGIPSIDYYIADPYVLPESAQDYYSETIWRLPQTYIAVDGFEVDVPTLRREDLDIPHDAIVYLMNQKGYKRHLEHLRLQIQIIKEVPNSYLLIKGDADPEASQELFESMSAEIGIDFSRIKFLGSDPSEAIHRANLQIVDVVMDTYPYNGATTTLETLWMGIPLVTRVGEQFSARNSYTMMINAGITEGIAWSAEEYIEWGVRLGKDEKLRQEISWKLRQGRKTAPLWDAKQFTRDMENAYEQMWQKYMNS